MDPEIIRAMSDASLLAVLRCVRRGVELRRSDAHKADDTGRSDQMHEVLRCLARATLILESPEVKFDDR